QRQADQLRGLAAAAGRRLRNQRSQPQRAGGRGASAAGGAVQARTAGRQRQRPALSRVGRPSILLESATAFHLPVDAMIELNPIRQRIADLTGRVVSLRGYL